MIVSSLSYPTWDLLGKSDFALALFVAVLLLKEEERESSEYFWDVTETTGEEMEEPMKVEKGHWDTLQKQNQLSHWNPNIPQIELPPLVR